MGSDPVVGLGALRGSAATVGADPGPGSFRCPGSAPTVAALPRSAPKPTTGSSPTAPSSVYYENAPQSAARAAPLHAGEPVIPQARPRRAASPAVAATRASLADPASPPRRGASASRAAGDRVTSPILTHVPQRHAHKRVCDGCLGDPAWRPSPLRYEQAATLAAPDADRFSSTAAPRERTKPRADAPAWMTLDSV